MIPYIANAKHFNERGHASPRSQRRAFLCPKFCGVPTRALCCNGLGNPSHKVFSSGSGTPYFQSLHFLK